MIRILSAAEYAAQRSAGRYAAKHTDAVQTERSSQPSGAGQSAEKAATSETASQPSGAGQSAEKAATSDIASKPSGADLSAEQAATSETATNAASVTAVVADVIANVKRRGDEALREYTKAFDNCDLSSFELSPDALDAALKNAGNGFAGVMERAARNIEDFHRHQIRQGFIMTSEGGTVMGQRIIPLSRAGIYIPGGTAAYPSSVLMNCIPAKLAGVGEIIMATPPSREGVNSAEILAAAKIAGVDRVFTIGGAQAIAAMAYGTETVPRVEKITGPGNAYVAEAKRQVFGVVGIDIIAGPSDILVIADGGADPVPVAADMLSQCEHGADSSAVLITDNAELASRVRAEIEEQLASLPRGTAARIAIDKNSMIVIADSIRQAVDISNEIAPEHLELFLDEPFAWLDSVKSAGSVFLGKNTPEALGDYCAGPNHTLPTSGAARFASPLSVDDFTKKSSFTYFTKEALQNIADDVICFAEMEGLSAHGESVKKRISRDPEKA